MKKVVVGLSGGVDSAVAAYLLKDSGYEVTGVHLNLVGNTEGDAAKAVAEHLGIGYKELDFREDFQKSVKEYFVTEYLAGRTPNPCCRCNRIIKFEKLLEWAQENEIEYLATGHYAKIIESPMEEGRFTVRLADCISKDQTYVLYALSQEQISRIVMPLGSYSKEEVRKIAEEVKIPVAAKKDSQDVCFIPDGDYVKYIKEYINEYNPSAKDVIPGPGNFLNTEGKIIGKHKGYINYTIGQRRGLEIAAGHRIFVKSIDPVKNEVVIADEDVFGTELTACDMNWLAVGQNSFDKDTRLFAKIRYAHKGEWCRLECMEAENQATCSSENIQTLKYKVCFENPVRAITPGQPIVFYNSDAADKYIVAGGTID